jgi:hypothetical protein
MKQYAIYKKSESIINESSEENLRRNWMKAKGDHMGWIHLDKIVFKVLSLVWAVAKGSQGGLPGLSPLR